MTEKILVEHLVKKYGDNTVLNDINVSINEGDVVCVIGPSGSGKSAFLRCLNQLEEASSGDIIIDGANLTDKNTDINQVRQHIGMVFQHFNLFPQAIRIMIPSFINQFVISLKDTTILSAIGLIELLQTGKIIVARTLQSTMVYFVIALIYLILITSLTKLAKNLEKKVN